MRNIGGWALLCTTNDPESLTIVRIARACNIPLLVSTQMHGAVLAKEPRLMERIAEISGVDQLAIVEIPGIHEENALRASGIEVHVIDHHTYPHVDRMHRDASLTQFLNLFEISDEDLLQYGFDPEIIHGVACIDQGFLWELAASNIPKEKHQHIRAHYLACAQEIHPEYLEIVKDAQVAWDAREERESCVIIRSSSVHHVREAIAFHIADAYPYSPPTSIILEGDGRISVQETDKAEDLFAAFGGFLFGKKRCWGMVLQQCMPTIDEIIAKIGG